MQTDASATRCFYFSSCLNLSATNRCTGSEPSHGVTQTPHSANISSRCTPTWRTRIDPLSPRELKLCSVG